MIKGSFEFKSWLLTRNNNLNDAALKVLYSLVCEASTLDDRKKTMKPLRDRAVRLGFSTVKQMIKVCDYNYQTCYTCKLKARYLKSCETCKSVYFCSLQCYAQRAKKHRKYCKKSILKRNVSPSKK